MLKLVLILLVLIACSCHQAENTKKSLVVYNRSGSVIDSILLLRPVPIRFSRMADGDSSRKEYDMKDTAKYEDAFVIRIYGRDTYLVNTFGYFDAVLKVPPVKKVEILDGFRLRKLN